MLSTPISWDNYLLCIAFVVSRKSKDSQTKHGSILVDENNIIIGTGYNSFPRNFPDDKLPNIRPEKYKYIIHSEENCIVNKRPHTGKLTLYTTGKPCLRCLNQLIQCGVKKMVIAKRRGWIASEDEQREFDEIINYAGVELKIIKPDFLFVTEMINEVLSEVPDNQFYNGINK